MSQEITGEPAEDGRPAIEAPLVGEGREPTAPSTWRQPGRIVSVGIVVALIVAAAVVVPMKLTSARTVSAAMGGVFSQPTVSIDLSVNRPAIAGDSLRLTLASRQGGAVAAAHSYDMDLAVLHHATVLADLRTTADGVYLRLNVPAISAVAPPGRVEKIVREAERFAKRHPGFSFINQLLAGRWVGIHENSLKEIAKKLAEGELGPFGALGRHKGASKQLRQELSNIGSSIGQSWDEVASLHEVGSGNGATEYSVSLPVRAFLLDAVKNVVKKHSGFPQFSALARSLERGIGHIPASEHLPIDLWISGGSLVKVAGTYKGTTVTALIGHPAAPTTPTGVTYINPQPILRRLDSMSLIQKLGSGSRVYSGSAPLTTVPTSAASASLSAGIAEFAVSESFRKVHSFGDLFSPHSPASLSQLSAQLDPAGLTWEQNRPSAGARQVSVHVGGVGSYAVVAVLNKSSDSCIGFLFVPAGSATPVLGAKRQAGIPYRFKTSGSSCNAAAITSVPKSSSIVGSVSSGASGQG